MIVKIIGKPIRVQCVRHLPGTGKNGKKESKEDVRREAAARGTVKKSKNVSVI